jgi:hypothetical protein
VRNNERLKTKVETRTMVSKTRRMQRRLVEAKLHGHPLRVSATEFARRRFLHLAAGAASLPAVLRDARAQAYPSRPITMIVPAPAGSANDTVGRIVAERMRKSLAQPIIIENIAGADGSIAAGRTTRAKPDGYTIDLGFLGNHVLNGAVYALQYDVLNDFAPISPLVTTASFLFARRTMPARDLPTRLRWEPTRWERASPMNGFARSPG